MNWTAEQLEAINKENTNIIVSAGAGSGKTAVLTRRVIRKIEDGSSINRLLLLTFTKASAKEMKDRIRKNLNGNKEELKKLDSAFITTFDSFSNSIVSKYHYLINIDKSFTVMNDAYMYVKTKEYLEAILEDLYKNNEVDIFNDFMVKDDSIFKNNLLSIYKSISLLINKDEYLDSYLDLFYSEDTYLSFLNDYLSLIKANQDQIKDLVSAFDNSGSNGLKMIETTTNIMVDDIDQLKLILSSFKLPVFRGLTEEEKYIKEEISILIKKLKEMISIKEELRTSYFSTYKYAKTIIKVIKELDNKLTLYKKKENSFTYTDIALMATDIMKNNKEAREEVKNMFDEIMIDEYQDTSDIQENFINLISNNNVYMVGDIKQSIYKFRNANSKIFMDKYKNYKNNLGGVKIDLVNNFRSREEVLNNINLMFIKFMTETYGGAEYSVGHMLEYGNKLYSEYKDEINYNMEVLTYNEDSYKMSKAEVEAFIIADKIKNIINSKVLIYDKEIKKMRKIEYKDFAILMDRGTDFDTYKKIFEYKEIPILKNTNTNVINDDIVLIIKNILELVLTDDYKHAFMSIGRSYLYSLSDDYLFDIMMNNKYSETDIYKKISLIKDNLNSKPIDLILEEIIGIFNLYEASIVKPDIDSTITRIDSIKLLASESNSIIEFYNSLKVLITDGYKIEVKTRNNSNNSVLLTTIHQSKGLEYEVCFLSGLYKKYNITDNSDMFKFDKKYGIITPYYEEEPKKLFTNYLASNNYINEEISEEIRLLYVALTRAKNKFYIVIPDKYLIDNKLDQSKYRSHADIIKSISNSLKDYINYEECIVSDYLATKKGILNYNPKSTDKLVIGEFNNSSQVVDKKSYSKKINELIDQELTNKLELGNRIHYIFEMIDFYNPRYDLIEEEYIPYIKSFIEQIDLNNVNIIKEYEFMYKSDNETEMGVIDLILEYDDHIMIIDYKLKNTQDDAYKNQVSGYKNYLSTITNKEIKTYLYSVIDKKLTEIKLS